MSQYNLDDYKLLSKQLIALIPENCSRISVLANASALLKTFFTEKVNWVGFYLVENSSLILGPFQGLVATTNIDFDKGFCGLCATNKKTVRIENVHSDARHIACDSASNSEIVVPIEINNTLYGVLDIDSIEISHFSVVDQEGLELFVKTLESILQKNNGIYF